MKAKKVTYIRKGNMEGWWYKEGKSSSIIEKSLLVTSKIDQLNKAWYKHIRRIGKWSPWKVVSPSTLSQLDFHREISSNALRHPE